MAIPILNLISNLWKCHRSKHTIGLTRPQLAGINQTAFLSQWGEPEINIGFSELQTSFKLNLPLWQHEPTENESLTAWIYEKRNAFLLFRRGKLAFHFRWSELRERTESLQAQTDPNTPIKPSAFAATTLSLFA